MESLSLNPNNNIDSAISLTRPEMQPSKKQEVERMPPAGATSETKGVEEDSGTTSAVQMSGSDAEQQSKELAGILQGIADNMNRSLEFAVSGEGEMSTITVTEKETGDLIREIPPEEQQRLSSKLQEMVGLLFDEIA